MSGNLDWKWIGIGVVIMIVLSLVAGMALGLFLMPEIQDATQVEDIELSGGQIVSLAIVNFLVFVIGGFIVGLKSAGRTILEPGISAAIAVIIALLLSRSLSLGSVLAGGLVPFLGGVLGGWIGERRQEAAAGPPSKA
ncbi:MAG TPA: hypothetical protein VNQ14_02330 [Woeseiaceae bacterium]|nr:hypothetical protein [Woeseiaceae bacterium]